jgi:hypothetical protein
MNLDAIWLVVLATATPIAGVVGFAIQLRTVQKVRLENQKLALEIANLERALRASKSQIVIPTNREVARIAHGMDEPLYCRDLEVRGERRRSERKLGRPWAVLLVAAAVGWYVVYDLIRFARWLYGLF